MIAAALAVALAAAPWDPEADARAVAALLAERCHECHGPEKQKARLRLDRPEGLGEVVVPGELESSLLWQRVSLPSGHDDVMPPKGETLTSDELALVRRWIEAGAAFAAPDAPDTRVTARAELERVAQATGALVLPVDSGGDPRGPLRVEFAYAERAPDAAAFTALAPIAERIAELGLAGTAVAPGSLAALPPLPALERAHLERTGLGDEDAAALVERAPNLRYLNLHSTAVTDASAFAGVAQLERVVLYGTPAEPGVAEPTTPFAGRGPRRILISDRAGARLALLRETALGTYDVVWEHPDPRPDRITWIGSTRVLLRAERGWTVELATGERQETGDISREPLTPVPDLPPFTAALDAGDGIRVGFEDRTLVEWSAAGARSLELTGAELGLDLALVQGLQRLDNGHLILRMAQGPGLVEVDRSGRIVWKLEDERFQEALVDAWILEDPYRWPVGPEGAGK